MEWFYNIAIVAIIAIVLALLIRHYLLFVVQITSYSMLPTLKPQQRIFARPMYNFDKLKRGDIIVFYSKEVGKTLVKRVIGLPGDIVHIHPDGQTYINGQALTETYVKCPGGPTGAYQVPNKKYFVLGDNRKNSQDSRHWREAYISVKAIKGKITLGRQHAPKTHL